ncbi:hypothetical protein GEMRC1_003953 [Eukaryota sp. GEM-RC1]
MPFYFSRLIEKLYKFGVKVNVDKRNLLPGGDEFQIDPSVWKQRFLNERLLGKLSLKPQFLSLHLLLILSALHLFKTTPLNKNQPVIIPQDHQEKVNDLKQHSSVQQQPPPVAVYSSRTLEDLEAALNISTTSHESTTDVTPVYSLEDISAPVYTSMYDQLNDDLMLPPPMEEAPIEEAPSQLDDDYHSQLSVIKEETLDELLDSISDLTNRNLPSILSHHSVFFELMTQFERSYFALCTKFSDLCRNFNELQDSYNKVFYKHKSSSTSLASCSCGRSTSVSASYKILKMDNEKLSLVSKGLTSCLKNLREDFIPAKNDFVKHKFKVEEYLFKAAVDPWPFCRSTDQFQDILPENSMDSAAEKSVKHVLDCLAIVIGFLSTHFNPSDSFPGVIISEYGPVLEKLFSSEMFPYPSAAPLNGKMQNLFSIHCLQYSDFLSQKVLSQTCFRNHRQLIATLSALPGLISYHKSSLGFPLFSLVTGQLVSVSESSHVFGLLNYCFSIARYYSGKGKSLGSIEDDLAVVIDRLPVGYVISQLTLQSNQGGHYQWKTFLEFLLQSISELFQLLSQSKTSQSVIHSIARIVVFTACAGLQSIKFDGSSLVIKCAKVLYEFPSCWSFLPALPLDSLSKEHSFQFLHLILTGRESCVSTVESLDQWVGLNITPNIGIFEDPRSEFLFSVLFAFIERRIKPISIICFTELFRIGVVLLENDSIFKIILKFFHDICCLDEEFLVVLLTQVINNLNNISVSKAVNIVRSLPIINNFAIIQKFLNVMFNDKNFTLAICLLDKLNVFSFSNEAKLSLCLCLISSYSSLLSITPDSLVSVLMSNSFFNIFVVLKQLKNHVFIHSLLLISKLICYCFLPSSNQLISVIYDQSPLIERETWIQSHESELLELIEKQINAPFSLQFLLRQGILALPLFPFLMLFNSFSTSSSGPLFLNFCSGHFLELLSAINRADIAEALVCLILTYSTEFVKTSCYPKIIHYLGEDQQTHLASVALCRGSSEFFQSILNIEKWYRNSNILSFLNLVAGIALANPETRSVIFDAISTSIPWNSDEPFDLIFHPRTKVLKAKRNLSFSNYPWFNLLILEHQFYKIEVPNLKMIYQMINSVSVSKISLLSAKNRNFYNSLEGLTLNHSLDLFSSIKNDEFLLVFLASLITKSYLIYGPQLCSKFSDIKSQHSKYSKKLSKLSNLSLFDQLISIHSFSTSPIEDLPTIINQWLPHSFSFYPNHLKTKLTSALSQSVSNDHRDESAQNQKLLLLSQKRSRLVSFESTVPDLPLITFQNSWLMRSFAFSPDLMTRGDSIIHDLIFEITSELKSLGTNFISLSALNKELIGELIPSLIKQKSSTKSSTSLCICGMPVSASVTVYESYYDETQQKLLLDNRRRGNDSLASLLFTEKVSFMFTFLNSIVAELAAKGSVEVNLNALRALIQGLLSFHEQSVFFVVYTNILNILMDRFRSNESIISLILEILIASTPSGPLFDYLLFHFEPHLCDQSFPFLYQKVCTTQAHLRILILSKFNFSAFCSIASPSSLHQALMVCLSVCDVLEESHHKQFLTILFSTLASQDPSIVLRYLLIDADSVSVASLELFLNQMQSRKSSRFIVDCSNIVNRYLTTMANHHISNLIVDVLGPRLSVAVLNLIEFLIATLSQSHTLDFHKDFLTVLNNCLTPFIGPSHALNIAQTSSLELEFHHVFELLGKIVTIVGVDVIAVVFQYLCTTVFSQPNPLSKSIISVFSSKLPVKYPFSKNFIDNLISVLDSIDTTSAFLILKSGTFDVNFTSDSLACKRLITLFHRCLSTNTSFASDYLTFVDHFVMSFLPKTSVEVTIPSDNFRNFDCLSAFSILLLHINFNHSETVSFVVSSFSDHLSLITPSDTTSSLLAILLPFLFQSLVVNEFPGSNALIINICQLFGTSLFTLNSIMKVFGESLESLLDYTTIIKICQLLVAPALMCRRLSSKFLSLLLNHIFKGVFSHQNLVFNKSSMYSHFKAVNIEQSVINDIAVVSADDDHVFSLAFLLLLADSLNFLNPSLFLSVSNYILSTLRNGTFDISSCHVFCLLSDQNYRDFPRLLEGLNSFISTALPFLGHVSVLKKYLLSMFYHQIFVYLDVVVCTD